VLGDCATGRGEARAGGEVVTRLASIPVAMFVGSLIGAGYGWIVGGATGAMVGNYAGAALGAWLAGRPSSRSALAVREQSGANRTGEPDARAHYDVLLWHWSAERSAGWLFVVLSAYGLFLRWGRKVPLRSAALQPLRQNLCHLSRMHVLVWTPQ
jgi:hypothetical protein